MEISDSEAIRKIIENVNEPIVFKNFCNWPLLKWSQEDWINNLPKDQLPFRCNPKTPSSDKPAWERSCPVKKMTFKEFLDHYESETGEWAYFDYKHIHYWFQKDQPLHKQVLWDSFGFPERSATESTIWIGSNGSHTPCHQDTYGRNIVVQAYGRKRWLLFPPETGGLKPTRVPYEESSIYSELNFTSPMSTEPFNGLNGCQTVELDPGDVLIVPHKWWHYVENISTIGISINMWIASEECDIESHVEEALVRLLIAQICKDLPKKLLPLILNPNEDELPDLPLTAAFLDVDSTIKKYVNFKSKKTGVKRLKLDTEATGSKTLPDSDVHIENLISKYSNIQTLKRISKDDLKVLLKNNINSNKRKYESQQSSSSDEILYSDNLTCSIINSFCQPSVIQLVKDNLVNQCL